MSTSSKTSLKLIFVSGGSVLLIFLYSIFNKFSDPKYFEYFSKFYHGNSSFKEILSLLDGETLNEALSFTQSNLLLVCSIVLVAIIFRKPLGWLDKSFQSVNRRVFLTVIFVLCLINFIFVFKVRCLNFPMGGDDVANIFQAKILSQGKLWTKTHPLKEFFKTDYVIDRDGKTYAEYALATSTFLALGILIEAPWLINPLLGSLALFFLYFIAVRLLDESIARYGIILIAISEYVIRINTGYNSHSASLFCLTGFLLFFLKTIDEDTWFYPVISGLFWGVAVNTRQLTALSFAFPFWIWGINSLIRENKKKLLPISLFIAGSFLPILGLLVVNTLQNGGPLIFGHTIYNGPRKTFGFSEEYPAGYAIGSYFFRLRCILDILIPGYFSPILTMILLVFSGKGKDQFLIWMAMLSVSVAYVPALSNLWQYRYYFVPVTLLLFLVVLGIRHLGVWLESRFKGLRPDSLILCFVVTCLFYFYKGFYYRPQTLIYRCTLPYRIIRDAGIKNSLVFIKSVWHFYPRWYCRNSPDYNDDILYVIDLGEKKNQDLMNYYPDRSYYCLDRSYLYPIGKTSKTVYRTPIAPVPQMSYTIWERG